MPTNTSIAPQSAPVRETQCCYCGSDNQPMRGKDIHVMGPRTWRLAVACIDAKTCSKRARERDSHMDERFSLTEAGRIVAMAFIEQAEQTRLPVAS
jgi:hypothetical protein